MSKIITLPKRILLAGLILILATTMQANNIAVSNVSLTAQNTTDNYTFVRFDISWENSWRTSSAPNNWDAAWVFVKYRLGSGEWQHATLGTTGHVAPSGSTITTVADNTGVFFYRDADGTGTFSKTGVKLNWDYGLNGVGDNDVVDVKVFAIEMVYVPQGSFYVGGGTQTAHFFTSTNNLAPYLISGESEIGVGTTVGELYYTSGHVDQGDMGGPIPAAFPKGFDAFYCMKYELTQQQYVDFLNMLGRSQQNMRTAVNLSPGVTNVTTPYIMIIIEPLNTIGSATPLYRNGIRCDETIDSSNPINFYCDYDGDGVGGEANDGQNIACNCINWADLAAYLDWAALRPMTEFEFEKVCRGQDLPAADSYAWGPGNLIQNTTISNPGMANEISANGGNATFKNGGTGGPMRVGAFATSSSTRVQAGASYYGAMEMSGNTWERPVTIGRPIGRLFTGIHGNGTLSNLGNADVINWPGTDADGGGFRGGWWDESNVYMYVSARGYASHVGDLRRARMGGRGVRTVN